MAKQMKEQGFAGIDINMGCPAPNVAPKGKGSGLINHPETATRIIAACKESGLPVSVKTRLGYTNINEWRGWITHLLNQDIVNLTIHLRARKEMSKVPAHYEVIADIKKLRDQIAPQTLLTINGDIRDRAHGMELVEKYGVDGIMIGRGVFHNPYCFRTSEPLHTKSDINPHLGTPLSEAQLASRAATPSYIATKDELIGLLNTHLDLYDKYQETTKRPYETLKRFYKIYIRDFDGASDLRDQLMHTKNTSEVRSILATIDR
jgi:tRNA-dihydrouridine synthase